MTHSHNGGAKKPKKRWLAQVPLMLLVAATMALGVYVVLHPAEKVRPQSDARAESTAEAPGPADFTYDVTSLGANDGAYTYRLHIADTTAKQQLGLGQRDALPADEGMLFPYQTPGERCFWMKDMRFAIDMIWLDADKKIVTVEADVKPETYPANFCPAEPAQYVIELNAGQAAKAGLQVGQTLRF